MTYSLLPTAFIENFSLLKHNYKILLHFLVIDSLNYYFLIHVFFRILILGHNNLYILVSILFCILAPIARLSVHTNKILITCESLARGMSTHRWPCHKPVNTGNCHDVANHLKIHYHLHKRRRNIIKFNIITI